jgi:hypothetical protein
MFLCFASLLFLFCLLNEWEVNVEIAHVDEAFGATGRPLNFGDVQGQTAPDFDEATFLQTIKHSIVMAGDHGRNHRRRLGAQGAYKVRDYGIQQAFRARGVPHREAPPARFSRHAPEQSSNRLVAGGQVKGTKLRTRETTEPGEMPGIVANASDPAGWLVEQGRKLRNGYAIEHCAFRHTCWALGDRQHKPTKAAVAKLGHES